MGINSQRYNLQKHVCKSTRKKLGLNFRFFLEILFNDIKSLFTFLKRIDLQIYTYNVLYLLLR